MIAFRDLSIRLKLIVLLGASAAIALSISAVMSLSLTLVTQRNESLRHLQQIADIASENLTAALAFNDNASASRLLGSLRANPQILAAIIHDDAAKPFSAYSSANIEAQALTQYLLELAALAAKNRAQLFDRHRSVMSMDFNYMFAITPIVFEGKVLGTLTIVSDNRDLREKLIYYVAMQTVISVVTLFIIAFISIRLQRVFTSPIFQLIDVIRQIADTKNYSVSVSTAQNDEFAGLYTHFNDMIAEIRERDSLLSRLATTDPLTGLANRRHAMEVMQTMVTRACRKRESFGLVMFDVDFFKKVNDQYGHPMGDIVLKKVGAIMAHMAREYDLVARIGGEEFLVLCDNSDLETTRMIAERMRMEVEHAVIACTDGHTLKVTVSAGVYAAVPLTEETDPPLKVADDALYRAKSSGRNRVSIGELT
jgi:diguanylate cyclase (GGDEF)-like protein